MSTNFFELQTAARRSTGWLITSFILATVVIVISVMAVVAVAIGEPASRRGEPSLRPLSRGIFPCWRAWSP